METLRRALKVDPRVAYAIVFGSVARGSAHEESDLDVAIGLASGATLDTADLGTLIARLEEVAGRTVDLVLLDEAPPGLAYRVFRDGRLLFSRDAAALSDRKARAILEYLDFKPIEDLFTRGALAAATRGR